MKLLTVVGARPQFVKAAAVSRAIATRTKIQEILVHTGQHFDRGMSDVFFEEMEIPRPSYNLGIANLGHGAMTGRMLEGIEEILKKESPDTLMVYGDTNSTLAGALAAKKLGIRVAHVEAGLRSYNLKMPEEINRVLADRISDLLFCPTTKAVENLAHEGFEGGPAEILQTGDVMYDAALYYAAKGRKATVLDELGSEEFVLCTVHRASNTDDGDNLRSIVRALESTHESIPVVLSLHPRTRAALQREKLSPRLHIIDPVGYFEMLALLQRCAVVMTDSGGLQKEAYFFRKQCVTLRDETEWTELIDQGWNRLAGANFESIGRCFDEARGTSGQPWADLYGGGKAAERIASRLAAG